jgi:hypothetical protein
MGIRSRNQYNFVGIATALVNQDQDDHATYSPTIDQNRIAAPAIVIFPNPVVNIMVMNIQTPKNENIMFNLYSKFNIPNVCNGMNISKCIYLRPIVSLTI